MEKTLRRHRTAHAGRSARGAPSSGASRDRLHFLPLGEATARLLRVDEFAVQGDFEHPTRTLHQLDFSAVDLREPVAHTERFGLVSSSATVFDPELHRFPSVHASIPGARIHPDHFAGQFPAAPAVSHFDIPSGVSDRYAQTFPRARESRRDTTRERGGWLSRSRRRGVRQHPAAVRAGAGSEYAAKT